MSHTVLFNDQEKKNVKESLKKVNVKESDKSTLGDLDVLADLKKKMVDDEKKKK
jgi:small subunit ribosomal protein S1